MRLIDAEALEPSEVYVSDEYARIVYMDDIDEMPTIDAEPVRHGKLMRTEAYPHKLYCGECFNTLIPNDEAVEQNWMLKPRYCMYC